MKKKRSKGVTIFAWVTIIINIILLLISFDFNAFFECYKSFSNNFIMVIISYTILSAAIGVIVGFGLLKLKDIMRRIGIVINSIDILFGIPTFIPSLNDIKQYFYSVAVSEFAKKQVNLNIDTLANVSFYTTIFLSVTVFVVNLLFIYFFTRPKVKEQFR